MRVVRVGDRPDQRVAMGPLRQFGQVLANRGDLESADGVLKAVLSIQRKLLGDENASTLETFTVLAKTLRREGKLSESESVWREASAIARKLWANNDLESLYILRGLGEALEDEGKWLEARDALSASFSEPVRDGNDQRNSLRRLTKKTPRR
jgi:tetratricopeptide (TPR) repeat protein